MPNLNYQRGRNKEYLIQQEFEKMGFIVFRTAGSHGIADLIAIRTLSKKCGDANHYDIRLIQVKSSEKYKERHDLLKAVETPLGYVNINYFFIPIKSKKHYALLRETKAKKRALLSTIRLRAKRLGLKQNKLRRTKKAISR